MINFYCDHNLKNTLLANEVESYAPAYNGESAGLDLYNSGASIIIKPVADFTYQNKILIPTGLRIIVPEGSSIDWEINCKSISFCSAYFIFV